MAYPVIPDVPVGNVQISQTGSVSGTLQNAATANGNGTALPLLGNTSIIYTVTMTGFTGVVNFECTEDNTNYDPLQVQQEGTNLIATSVTGNASTSTHLYEASIAGFQSVRSRISGYSAGSVTVTAHAIPSTDAPRAINAVNTDGQKATYSAVILGLVPAATPTDIFTIGGSASKVIRITRLIVSALQTTAGSIDIRVTKRSGGTQSAGTAATVASNDTNNPTATATPQSYTSNPASLGTSIGDVYAGKLFVPAAATAVSPGILTLDFGNRPAQAQVLRGVAQFLSVNLNSVTLTGGSVDLYVEWSEE